MLKQQATYLPKTATIYICQSNIRHCRKNHSTYSIRQCCRDICCWWMGGLTACTPGSAPDPTLSNKYGKPLPLPGFWPGEPEPPSSPTGFFLHFFWNRIFRGYVSQIFIVWTPIMSTIGITEGNLKALTQTVEKQQTDLHSGSLTPVLNNRGGGKTNEKNNHKLE